MPNFVSFVTSTVELADGEKSHTQSLTQLIWCPGNWSSCTSEQVLYTICTSKIHNIKHHIHFKCADESICTMNFIEWVRDLRSGKFSGNSFLISITSSMKIVDLTCTHGDYLYNSYPCPDLYQNAGSIQRVIRYCYCHYQCTITLLYYYEQLERCPTCKISTSGFLFIRFKI